MLKQLDAPAAAPSVKNVMDAAQKYLPVHEKCSAIGFDFVLNKPVDPDRLLNSLFPATIAAYEKCNCEAGKVAEINCYLDVLSQIFG